MIATMIDKLFFPPLYIEKKRERDLREIYLLLRLLVRLSGVDFQNSAIAGDGQRHS